MLALKKGWLMFMLLVKNGCDGGLMGAFMCDWCWSWGDGDMKNCWDCCMEFSNCGGGIELEWLIWFWMACCWFNTLLLLLLLLNECCMLGWEYGFMFRLFAIILLVNGGAAVLGTDDENGNGKRPFPFDISMWFLLSFRKGLHFYELYRKTIFQKHVTFDWNKI